MAQVPLHLTQRLIDKLQSAVFDIGDVVSLAREESGRVVVVAQKDLEPEEEVWLVDHQWTFSDLDAAKQQLKSIHSLRARVSAMVGIPSSNNDAPVDSLWAVLSFFFGSYQESTDESTIGNSSSSHEKVFYLLDEVGSRLIAADEGKSHFESALVTTANLTYTAVWCVKKVEEGDIITCSGLPKGMRRLAELQSCLSFDFLDEEMRLKNKGTGGMASSGGGEGGEGVEVERISGEEQEGGEGDKIEMAGKRQGKGQDEGQGGEVDNDDDDERCKSVIVTQVATSLQALFKIVDYTTKEVSERVGVLTKDGIEQGSGIGGSCFPYAEVSSVENREMYRDKLVASFSDHSGGGSSISSLPPTEQG